jgi:hypothetical protein
MKKIIIKDDEKVIGKWRVEKLSDFDDVYKSLKMKHEKIEIDD